MIMRVYTIWYSGSVKGKQPRDVFIAKSAIEAAKAFIIETKGRYIIHRITVGNFYEANKIRYS